MNPDLLEGGRWPLDWRSLYPRERWLWWEQLWMDVCALRERYRLPVRSGWWEDSIQVEALAACAAWVDRYDIGEWDDPPGKLALLFELDRINGLLSGDTTRLIQARAHAKPAPRARATTSDASIRCNVHTTHHRRRRFR